MLIKLNENYQNGFITTTKGYILKKGEEKTLDITDRELIYYLEQGILIVSNKKGVESKMYRIKKENCPICKVELVGANLTDLETNKKVHLEQQHPDFKLSKPELPKEDNKPELPKEDNKPELPKEDNKPELPKEDNKLKNKKSEKSDKKSNKFVR